MAQHDSTYEPSNAFTQWLDTRLPILRLSHDSFVDFPDAQKLELLVDVRRHSDFLPGNPNHHRRCVGDALHTARGLCLCQHRTHHARCELRLAVALYARQRRIDVLFRRVHPYVSRHLLRLI